jgi:hypothetical protein
VGTVNVGSRAPAWPLFYMALREGGALPRTAGAPRVSDRADPEIRSRSGDPVWGEITSLTRRSHHFVRTTCSRSIDPTMHAYACYEFLLVKKGSSDTQIDHEN